MEKNMQTRWENEYTMYKNKLPFIVSSCLEIKHKTIFFMV